jgi:hypothetical protein
VGEDGGRERREGGKGGKERTKSKGWGCSLVVECLPSMHGAWVPSSPWRQRQVGREGGRKRS